VLVAFSLITANQAQAEPDIRKNSHYCSVRILANDEYFKEIMKAVADARKEIVMAFYIFKTNGYKGNYPDAFIEGLASAVKRGVKVKVVLERTKEGGSSLDLLNTKTAHRLRKRGVDVHFDSPSVTTHVKLVVIDKRLTFVGSHNMTNSALKYNNEVSLAIESPETAVEAVQYINSICR
jgi:phosphatidylserine/phosphatidylglycerophosphate/cardiolipin synthase-like enzyme